ALSIVVLVAAALFGQTLRNLRTADTGFEREHLLLASISTSAYPVPRQRAFYVQLLEKLRATPGVSNVALSNDIPLNVNTGWTLRLADAAGGTSSSPALDADVSFVSRDYFKTVGIPLIAGRVADTAITSASDDAHREPMQVLVNETFARQYFAGRNP